MSTLVRYLRQEGVVDTAKRILSKFLFGSASTTIFLRAEYPMCDPHVFAVADVEVLMSSNRVDFDSIKFWDFVRTDDYINNEHQSVLLLKMKDEYVAYAAEEHGKKKDIHGLGSFLLEERQAWIGPVYVTKKWRGNGINRFLVLKQMQRLHAMGINEVFTSINSQNTSSLKSFKKAGFAEVGQVNKRGVILRDMNNILSNAFCVREK